MYIFICVFKKQSLAMCLLSSMSSLFQFVFPMAETLIQSGTVSLFLSFLIIFSQI